MSSEAITKIDQAIEALEAAKIAIGHPVETKAPEQKLWHRKGVLIEVGHGPYPGGFEKGASARGVHEYDLNWDAAKACSEALSKLGIPSQITDSGLSLYDIGKLGEEYDVFMSIHHNAFDGDVQGCEVLVHKDKHDDADVVLGGFVSKEMSRVLGFRNRGVKANRRLGVLSGAEDAEKHYSSTKASVLAECYFMDALPANHSATSKRAGRAIATGIHDFLKWRAGV
jgi:N-acetylmuramoyl-L-alanine amidase